MAGTFKVENLPSDDHSPEVSQNTIQDSLPPSDPEKSAANNTHYDSLASEVWKELVDAKVKDVKKFSKDQNVEEAKASEDSIFTFYTGPAGDTHETNRRLGLTEDRYKNDTKAVGELLPDCNFVLDWKGPDLIDNFKEIIHPDGTISVTDNNKEFKLIDDKEVHKCRETLCKLADNQIGDPVQLAKFYGDVTRFEDRVTNQIESNLRRSGLSSEQAQTDAHAQVKQTYRDLTKLLESPNKENIELGASRKMQVVRQIMQQAADPRCIDQGNHPTCNVTDVEIRTYARTPAEATKLVVDLLVDGQYQAKGEKYQSTGDGKRQGVIVSLDSESLKPHGSAKQVLNQDGERSYASQIFQVAATNIGYKLEYRKESYHQVEPNNGITDDANNNNDGGDRIVSRVVPGISKEMPVKDSNIKDKLIVKIGNAISGTDKGDWLINYGIPNEGPTTCVDSPDMLWQKLKDAKEQGNFPIVIGIDAMHEPFLSDAGLNPRNRSQENESGHVVLVTDIVEGPPESVLIDDTNGTKHDHILKPVPLTDLYFSLRPASDRQSVQEQESLLRSMRRAGKQNELQELDCLALRRDHGLIDPQNYLTELARARAAHKAIDEMTVRNMPDAKIFRHMQIDRKIDNLCAQLPLDQHFKMLEDQDKTDPRFQQSMLNAYQAAQDQTLTILDPEQGQPGDFIVLNGFVNSYRHFADFLKTCSPEIQDQAKAVMKEAEGHSQYEKFKALFEDDLKISQKD